MSEVPSGFVPTAFDVFAYKVDTRFPEDVHLLGECGLQVFERLTSSQRDNKIPERILVFPLLLNGLTTTTAALELWRRGLVLQVGILLRNAIEAAATAAVISSDKVANEQYRLGRYNSAEAFSHVKKTWPVMGSFLGKANGILSGEFVHVGKTYRAWHHVAWRITEDDIQTLRSTLLPIKMTLYVFDVLSEWVCWEAVSSARYWEKVGANEYRYRVSPDGQKWLGSFFKEDLSKATEQ